MHPQSSEKSPMKVTLHYRDSKMVVTMEGMNEAEMFESLRSQAKSFVEQTSPVDSDVYLFRHESPSVLHHITSGTDLSNDCIVEVIVVDQKPIRPHDLKVKTYKTLTFCDFCGATLSGFVHQGLQCRACKCNYHSRCCELPQNNCDWAISTPPPSAALTLPHMLVDNTFHRPTKCIVCDKLIYGLIRQGEKCKDCMVCVHHRCAHLLPSNCTLSEKALNRMSFIDQEKEHSRNYHRSSSDNSLRLQSSDLYTPNRPILHVWYSDLRSEGLKSEGRVAYGGKAQKIS